MFSVWVSSPPPHKPSCRVAREPSWDWLHHPPAPARVRHLALASVVECRPGLVHLEQARPPDGERLWDLKAPLPHALIFQMGKMKARNPLLEVTPQIYGRARMSLVTNPFTRCPTPCDCPQTEAALGETAPTCPI